VLARVASALAAFHAVRVAEIVRRFGPGDDLAVVEPWVALVTRVFPGLRETFEAALRHVRDAAPPDDPTRATLVHRDFYDHQVLVAPERIGFLDLDTACLGDAEIDVANFCAHLRLRALQKNRSTAAAIGLAREFIAVYSAARPATDADRIRWYQASTLLRLACLYALRPAWHALAPRMADDSRKVLSEA
jgi:aminoglycoside phosphotransferase (APT) family kinase protein